MFGVSHRQENKENPSCQCDSDLESPVGFHLLKRKREELVTSFKEGQTSYRQALRKPWLCEFLLLNFSFSV